MQASSQFANHRLMPRDELIVQHVGRHRLTTLEVLRRVVLPDVSPNGLRKLTNRLCQGDLLRRFPLFYPTQYFVLGDTSARLLGLSAQRTAPLGPQALPAEYAVLAHVALGKLRRTRLTRQETLSRYPWLPPELAAAPHCLDEQHQLLELVRVDLGGPADHVARKCARDLKRRRHLPEFNAFVAQGRFRLAVVTATQEKATAVRQALDRHDWPSGLLIHLSVVPKLLSLLASRNHA